MAIYNFKEALQDDEEQEENSLLSEQELVVKRPFFKSLGLRVAFLFAEAFCMLWFVWATLSFFWYSLLCFFPFSQRFIFQKKKLRYRKSLTLTLVSFVGCALGCLSPHMGLSFLTAYFGIFAPEFHKEGICLDDLIRKVKRLSA